MIGSMRSTTTVWLSRPLPKLGLGRVGFNDEPALSGCQFILSSHRGVVVRQLTPLGRVLAKRAPIQGRLFQVGRKTERALPAFPEDLLETRMMLGLRPKMIGSLVPGPRNRSPGSSPQRQGLNEHDWSQTNETGSVKVRVKLEAMESPSSSKH
jgi:hypothetical protein